MAYINYVNAGMPGIVSPALINEYSAMSIPSYWRAVNFLSANLASFPRSIRLDGTATKHQLDRLLERRPNQYQTATTFWRTLFSHSVQFGNGYAQIARTGNKITGLYNLLPDDVTPFRFKDAQYYWQASTKTMHLASDIIHLPGLSYDGMVGYSPICILRDTFQHAKTIGQHQTRYLEQGTVLRGSIEIPSGVSDERLKEVVDTLRTYFRGADSERDVIVLSDGAKLNNATLSPQESQLQEQANYSTKQIAQVTGVPPQFLYEFGESKYNNSIEQMGLDVVRYTFRPLLDLIEDELSMKLLDEREQESGYAVHLNPDALLRGDTKTQSDVAIAQVAGGLRTRNEGRAVLGLPADTDPASDKLSQLGDTTPQASREAPTSTPPVKASIEKPAADTFAALRPILDAAVTRIEAKTEKAFSSREGKPDSERTIWANVFSSQQEKYAVEAIQPVADALAQLGGPALDVAAVAEQYAGGIRRRAAGQEVRGLGEIVELAIRGNDGSHDA